MKPQSPLPKRKTYHTPNLLGHPALKAAAGGFGGCRFLNQVASNFGAETLLSADIQNLKGERANGCGCFIYAECLAIVVGGRVNLCQVD